MGKSDISKEQEICLKCRRCCEYVTFSVMIAGMSSAYINDLYRYYKARGFTIFSIPNFMVIRIKQPCEQLTIKGCKIYDERPALCMLYDGRNDQFLQCDLEKSNNE